MERESPENSTSSSLEQSKLSSIMPHFRSPRQPEKRSRIVDGEGQMSYLALLTGAESPEAQQIGPSFPRPAGFVPFRNPDLDAQPPYWMPNPSEMPTTPPTLIRPMAIQGTRNATCGINFEGSTLKRKTVCENEIAPNPNTGGAQGFSSSSYGYSVYDERYHAVGLPVDPHLRMLNAILAKGNAGFS